MLATDPPRTPDGRYIVVRGRLWRASNPNLSPADRFRLVGDLMVARRAVTTATRLGDVAALRAARSAVQTAKVGLGERGPVWWTDGAPDENRRLARNTIYADWWRGIDGSTPPASSAPAVEKHAKADSNERRVPNRRNVMAGQAYEVRYFAAKHGLNIATATQIIAYSGGSREKANAIARKLKAKS